ncbi:DnaD domain protein [Lysinibacillus sp. A4]|uniref:DnaD domain protein n=1 Tax=Lysinibacillus sp. A4 TaxID=2976269 RepID=UPI0021758E50|nr:DnaD domain protein [Lysinibacillus sp. A4]MCS5500908.1 DnaD domain protein [Lysinibacillus sp. A4]
MGIIRVAKNSNYVVMNRTALNDNRLSWKAKGIMAYMLSMPDDWVFHMKELVTHSTDGERAFRAGFKELQDHGYVTRQPVREGQRIASWETIVHEVPQEDSLLCGFVHVENEEVQNVHVQNEDVQNSRLLSTDNNQVLNKPNTDNNQVLTEREESQSVNPFLEIKNSFDSIIRVSNFTDHKKMDMLLELYPDYLLIIEAIKLTADLGKSSVEYVRGILHNWSTEKGVKSYADWQVKINAETKRSNGSNYGQAQSQKPSVFGDYCSD